MADRLGAFVDHCDICIEGAAAGPLAGATFAAKDLYHVAGTKAGCGNPDWLASHEADEETAPVIRKLLSAGATLIGKTHTDEIAYSMNGENHFYGTPRNVNAPGRIPGGSSSGSTPNPAAGSGSTGGGSSSGGSSGSGSSGGGSSGGGSSGSGSASAPAPDPNAGNNGNKGNDKINCNAKKNRDLPECQ